VKPEGAVRASSVSAAFELLLGSPDVRFDIVPLDLCSSQPPIDPDSKPVHIATKRASVTANSCVPDSIVSEFAGAKSIGQVHGYPQHNVRRQENIWFSWDGSFAPGQFAPPGQYKIVAHTSYFYYGGQIERGTLADS
jgi:hypothetical protein